MRRYRNLTIALFILFDHIEPLGQDIQTLFDDTGNQQFLLDPLLGWPDLSAGSSPRN
ncbi:MAG: hypothetical protein WCC28_07000 [Mycobacterium sp.]|uniref:hypothetical protein n=1 Tax=Mycobacterium sp. TaxID=1785 RepID=UPI003C76A9D1